MLMRHAGVRHSSGRQRDCLAKGPEAGHMRSQCGERRCGQDFSLRGASAPLVPLGRLFYFFAVHSVIQSMKLLYQNRLFCGFSTQ